MSAPVQLNIVNGQLPLTGKIYFLVITLFSYLYEGQNFVDAVVRNSIFRRIKGHRQNKV